MASHNAGSRAGRKRRIMRALKINEISGVDVPAQESAVAVIMKRKGEPGYEEIGREVGLEKYSSVSTAYLRMKERISKERKLNRRAKQIENHLLKSQEQT